MIGTAEMSENKFNDYLVERIHIAGLMGKVKIVNLGNYMRNR